MESHKKKTKFLCVLSVLTVTLFAGCTKNNELIPTDTDSTIIAESTNTPVPTSTSVPTNTPEPTKAPTNTPTPTSTPTPIPTSTPTPIPTPSPTPTAMLTSTVEETDDGLTLTQRNSINILNYMTVLTQKVNESKGDQLFLESAYKSLYNNIFPSTVDNSTQSQIGSLLDTIKDYKMIDEKRKRLEFIYEQKKAQAMRAAIPNPIGLLSAVRSEDLLKTATSVLYMAIDSALSYQTATSQADLQFIQDGWELDDAEAEALHNSIKGQLNYMLNMVRNYDIPGDYALNLESIEKFVLWSSKPESQLVNKIKWFESNQSTYEAFGPYWLELAKDYYDSGDYKGCLNAVKEYEKINTRIFRKNIDYARILPMAIISAKETMNTDDYITAANQYCSIICDNIKDTDWELRYFVAQIYLDLYNLSSKREYMSAAYKNVYDNVVTLVDEQKALNISYLAKLEEIKPKPDATKREKKETKNYNKLIKEERKIALPPVSESLYLNCDLLFAIITKKPITLSDQKDIDAILHENGKRLFLTEVLDDRFWFFNPNMSVSARDIEITYDKGKMTVAAKCVTDRSTITVTVTGSEGETILTDWVVDSVNRPNNSEFDDFMVYYSSKTGKDHKFKVGDTVKVKIVPVEETPEKYLEFKYNVIRKTVGVVPIPDVSFERIYE
ncbi:MAG: hypothetical protein K6G81_09045 [Lachnospiraceae bacterium]|nr:hypothetical protein [Lachnospiraceae bacterium]